MDISNLQRLFAKKNLDRLSRLRPPTKPVPGKGPFGDDSSGGLGLKLLQEWSRDNKETLQAAIEKQAYGGKFPINWTNAFLPFMESMAVYLRDYNKVVEAWKLYQEFKTEGSDDMGKCETAISIYLKAYFDIDVLAREWDMGFIVLCDLVDQYPKDHPHWDGPFCGAFFTTANQQRAPFIGLTFKGTKPTRKAEVQVDYNYDQHTGAFLDKTHCSIGVYTGLFGQFNQPNDPPYKNILSETKELASRLPNSLKDPVRVHVTGHSLGGSYSSFCYTQLLMDVAPGGMPITMGDEYTFGAPRVGSDDYVQLNAKLVDYQAGQSWRIVNDQDIVPQIPPTEIPPATPERLHFHHIDNGMQIFPNKGPEKIASERGRKDWPKPYGIKTLDEFIKALSKTKDHSKPRLLYS